MDTVMNRELLEELEALGDQGLFYKMLDVLQDYVEDGEDQGRFTREAAEGDLELALWVAYADLNIDEYESYYQAIRWLERVRGAAFGSGVWYYRLASAYIYTGQLQKARETAEQGAQVAPDYAWGWLNTAKLRAHFGDREGALAAVERGLALEPGDYEFTRTRAEIEAGAALDEMECHYIDPEADRQLQTDPELLAEKRQSVRCILCDEENLAAVKAALGAQTWEFEAPYCYCTLPYQGGELSARFDMNEAGVSKFTAAWAAQLAARLAELDGMAAALVAEKHPGARLELGHVVFQRSGGVLLGYHVGKSREERLYAYAAFGADLAPVGGVTYRDYTGDENEEEGFYMPVQRVCRPDHTFRGFQGQIEAGEVKVGDEITTLPSNETAHVKSIHVGDKLSDSAFTGQPVTIQLDREVDVSRGCVLTIGSGAKVASSITATILWMDDDELFKGKNFFFKLGTKSIPGIVTEIEHTIDVNTGEEKPADKLKKNEIAVVKIAFSDKIVCDKFKNHKTLGEFILIDRVTDMTSACGVVEEVHTEESGLYEGRVDRNVRAAIKGQKAITAVFVDGVDGVNRGFVEDVEKALNIDGRHTYLYAPKEGEDFVNVVKHLSHAGILVLLLISQKQEKELAADKVEFTKDWNKNGRDVDKAAEFIKKQSVYDGVIVNTSEYI